MEQGKCGVCSLYLAILKFIKKTHYSFLAQALIGITGRKACVGGLPVSNAVPRLSPGLSHLT